MADQADAAARDVTANREAWTQINAAYTDDRAYRAWMASEIAWGIFNVPESQLGVLGEVRGLDVVELGCGTAYFSAWLARRGARPVGVDVTAAQLRTARRGHGPGLRAGEPRWPAGVPGADPRRGNRNPSWAVSGCDGCWPTAGARDGEGRHR